MSERMIKTGGLAGLLAAVLFLTITVLAPVVGVRSVNASPVDYLIQAVNVIGFLAVAVAILGFRALQSRSGRFSRLGLVGAGLAAVGHVLFALMNVYDMVQGERSLVSVRIGVSIVLLVGSVILGFLVLRTRLLGWWCGVLLIVAFPLGDVANALFVGAESLLLALCWGSVGAGLLARATATADGQRAEPARVG